MRGLRVEDGCFMLHGSLPTEQIRGEWSHCSPVDLWSTALSVSENVLNGENFTYYLIPSIFSNCNFLSNQVLSRPNLQLTPEV